MEGVKYRQIEENYIKIYVVLIIPLYVLSWRRNVDFIIFIKETSWKYWRLMEI